jgi:hypothetical protein
MDGYGEMGRGWSSGLIWGGALGCRWLIPLTCFGMEQSRSACGFCGLCGLCGFEFAALDQKPPLWIFGHERMHRSFLVRLLPFVLSLLSSRNSSEKVHPSSLHLPQLGGDGAPAFQIKVLYIRQEKASALHPFIKITL